MSKSGANNKIKFENLDEVRQYLFDVYSEHSAALEQFFLLHNITDMDTADLMEDVANEYLDHACLVREQHVEERKKNEKANIDTSFAKIIKMPIKFLN